MKTRAACAVLVAVLLSSAANAHDTWMLPIDGANGVEALALTSGMAFPAAETAIKPDRVETAAILLENGATAQLKTFKAANDHLRIVIDSPTKSALAYLSLFPKTLQLDAGNVSEYLAELGDADGSLRAHYERDGQWRERYVKHAKALIGPPSDLWMEKLGARLELVLQGSAHAIAPNALLRAQLLFNGQALPNHRIAVGTSSASGHQFVQTSADGIAEFRLPHAGNVLLSTIRIVHVVEAERDWESDFATLTLSVPN